jgi:hypothetical protein
LDSTFKLLFFKNKKLLLPVLQNPKSIAMELNFEPQNTQVMPHIIENLTTSFLFAAGGEGGPVAPAHTGGTSQVHPLLSSFINYIQSVKFQGRYCIA